MGWSKSAETFISLPTVSKMVPDSQDFEPTQRRPLLLYPRTEHRGASRPLRLGEEVEFVNFDAAGVARYQYSSLKLFPSNHLVLRAYHQGCSQPKVVTATPRNWAVYDFDRYLREDSQLQLRSVFGYMPGDTFSARFTVSAE